jgi:carbonic anhydrase
MTEDSMEMLLKRAVNFRRKDYENNKDLFNKLKEQQTPHTLFISCSDSRVDPNMITGSLPGELFTIRNIANIVPPFRESNNYVSTASAIEYAVLMLGVDNIIVCGHSDCGGCAAYLKPEEYLDEFPHTKKWLNLSHEVRDRVIKDITADDYGKREFAWTKRHNKKLSLLMMDLDCFKIVNDTFGHAAGDQVIREMGSIIMASFRKTDIVGRIGGEEFAVVLKNASFKDAKKVAEQFRETVAGKKVIYGNQVISITVSIGVASICGDTDDSNNIEDILKKADDALYKAKAKGRNCVATLGSGMEDATLLDA